MIEYKNHGIHLNDNQLSKLRREVQEIRKLNVATFGLPSDIDALVLFG